MYNKEYIFKTGTNYLLFPATSACVRSEQQDIICTIQYKILVQKTKYIFIRVV